MEMSQKEQGITQPHLGLKEVTALPDDLHQSFTSKPKEIHATEQLTFIAAISFS